ncbi:MAG: GNAT family N-acetyltransferase [Oscillospiraceae bacterium]|nr:GNAT family N-acetyltransferase [Oscillospiraceae bacterium]
MFLKKKARPVDGYHVVRADKKQADIVFSKFFKDERKRDNAVVFVALDGKAVIGYSVIHEKQAQHPLGGTDWFVWNIYTRPEWRRRGVASTLLSEIKRQAEEEGVLHIQGSCVEVPAHMFWNKHGFCAQRYGSPLNDGTCSHMVFYRIDKTEPQQNQHNFRIVMAGKARLHRIFDESILGNGVPFFQDKRDDIFGFVAVDENENTLGFITACPDELGAPLTGTRWLIPYIFVNPELRRKGIATALLGELLQSAQRAGIAQVDALRLNDETALFFYKNNFDLCVWYIMDGEEKPISAALRM